MAVVMLTSAGGAPGVTTTALAMALTWPREVLLADVDSHPNQTILAGYLRGVPAANRGLTGIAAAVREQRFADARLAHQTVMLDDGPTPRRFLPGFAHPHAASAFERSWGMLAEQFTALAGQGDVIIDAGRYQAGLPQPLVDASRLVIVVTRSNLPHLAALRLSLPHLREQVRESSAQLGIVVVGPGDPYSSAEVAASLEVGVIGELPWIPEEARVLFEGQPMPRRFTSSRMWRAWQQVSEQVCQVTGIAEVSR